MGMKHIMAICFLALGVGTLSAAPIVTYTVGGSSADWLLDFNVQNTTNQLLYFFGVELPSNLTGSPTGWGSDGTWNTGSGGGSGITYDNTWITLINGVDGVPIGGSLSGFLVTDTSVAAPTNVNWFAYTFDGYGGSPYTGSDNFNGVDNPGFEGVASTATPEPVATGLLAAAFLFMILRRSLPHRAV